ncbi:cupin domain-containing protein [uncultured Ruegeria sp.]|uniref:cupin domain-containing protein n=1 Tax=uncultured Ruegeria sp. TaxID=259304 RepID=UPI002609C518|nr:cupin domain-containing protein [uncultured Ruegeria sp.]
MILTTFTPDASSGDTLYSHKGEEGGYFVEVTLELTVEDQVMILMPGDSFRFKTFRPHHYHNIGLACYATTLQCRKNLLLCLRSFPLPDQTTKHQTHIDDSAFVSAICCRGCRVSVLYGSARNVHFEMGLSVTGRTSSGKLRKRVTFDTRQSSSFYMFDTKRRNDHVNDNLRHIRPCDTRKNCAEAHRLLGYGPSDDG